MLQYAEQFCNFCMIMIFRGWGGPLDTTVQLRHTKLDYPQHRPQGGIASMTQGGIDAIGAREQSPNTPHENERSLERNRNFRL